MSEKKERLAELKEKMKDTKFLKEGLGALEFKYMVTDDKFEEREVEFRIERSSLQAYSRARSGKTGDILMANMIKNFIALPVEARDVEFFKMSSGALEEIVEICNNFQEFPLSL